MIRDPPGPQDGGRRQAGRGLAHDFNNLLMAITGYAEILQQRMDPGLKHPRSA